MPPGKKLRQLRIADVSSTQCMTVVATRFLNELG